MELIFSLGEGKLVLLYLNDKVSFLETYQGLFFGSAAIGNIAKKAVPK